MRKSKWIFGILLLLVIAGLRLGMKEAAIDMKLANCLMEQESLIDYATEGQKAYAIVSSTNDQEYGDYLIVFHKKNGGYEREYSNNFSDLKPWKLELADIDGDGNTELLTGVRKKTHYDPVEKNRLFVFNYIEGKLVKKWTGSQIAGTWKDFYVGDYLPVKGDEVLFISQTENGRERLGIYYWFKFGFLLLAQSEGYETIEGIRLTDEGQLQMIYSKAKKEWIDLVVKNGKITSK